MVETLDEPESVDFAAALDFGKLLYERICEDLVDIVRVRDAMNRICGIPSNWGEVRLCKSIVLPAVAETVFKFLSERFGASYHDVKRALLCEGFQTLAYEETSVRPLYHGSSWLQELQPLSKDGKRKNAGTNPDFAVRYWVRTLFRLAGEVKFESKCWRSGAAVVEVQDDLKHYLAVRSASYPDWRHDFGFGIVYCARGDHPRKAELLVDQWESNRILVANFTGR